MFEKYLIEICSPTLASLKTASLFSYRYQSEKELRQTVMYWNMQMRKKGIKIAVLRVDDVRALIYIYREAYLARDFSKPEVAGLLRYFGYEASDIDKAIGHLRERLSDIDDFPHEIGLFLGYPVKDVIGFIIHKGSHSKYTGFWKVYGDKAEALKIFAMFDKCTRVYVNLWNQGRSIEKLTVAT